MFYYTLFQVMDCFEVEGEAPVKYSTEALLVSEKYDIV
jgi:hypothetical protein